MLQVFPENLLSSPMGNHINHKQIGLEGQLRLCPTGSNVSFISLLSVCLVVKSLIYVKCAWEWSRPNTVSNNIGF